MLNNRDKLDSFATIMRVGEDQGEGALGDYEGKCGPWRGLPKDAVGAFEEMVEHLCIRTIGGAEDLLT